MFPFTAYEFLQRGHVAIDAWGPICLSGVGEEKKKKKTLVECKTCMLHATASV